MDCLKRLLHPSIIVTIFSVTSEPRSFVDRRERRRMTMASPVLATTMHEWLPGLGVGLGIKS
jgi:hypothetical protein